jgi:hypothetical protein
LGSEEDIWALEVRDNRGVDLHCEKLYDLYFTPNKPTVVVIKSRKIRRVMLQVAGRGKLRTGFWLENLNEGDYLKDLGLDKRIILKIIFRECDGGPDSE